MRETINYMIEANLGLLIFLMAYKLVLSHETNFRFARFFMLAAIFVCLLFPLIRINTASGPSLPSVNSIVPTNWLPEIIISGDGPQTNNETKNIAYDVWQIGALIYGVGALVFFVMLIIQLRNVLQTIKNGTAYYVDKFKVVETSDDAPTFSFFHLISIGKANTLTAFEKQQIIQHEAVHAQQLHSLDILFVTLLRVVFWFNPFITLYKKIFVQLHEFEADARAVENSDVNKYCALLARVALQSVHFPIASHFNQSLTLKRIEMMRTLKQKIKPWKFLLLAGITTLSFFIIACQDQLVSELEKSTVSQTADYPPVVRADMDAYMKEHKDAKLTYMEGIPDEIDKLTATLQGQKVVVNTYNINNGGLSKKGVLLSNVTQYADQLQTDDQVFMVVEQQPEYIGGYDALRDFIRQNMKYPEDALKAGKSGTVYVSMVINTDGSISDTKVLRGIDPLLDAESARVISILPKWKPGMQNGKPVRVRFNIPVKWDPNSSSNPVPPSGISPVQSKLNITTSKTVTMGRTIIQGAVLGDDGKPLSRATILIKGTTVGTKTDELGNFKLESPTASGELVFSYIGYEFRTISY